MFRLHRVDFCGFHGWKGIEDCDCPAGTRLCQRQSSRCHAMLHIWNTQNPSITIRFVYATGAVPEEVLGASARCTFGNKPAFKRVVYVFDQQSTDYDTAEEMNAAAAASGEYVLSAADISQFSATEAVCAFLQNRNMHYTNGNDNRALLHPRPEWLLEGAYSADDARNADPTIGNIGDLVALTQRAIDELAFIYEGIKGSETRPLLK